LIDIHCHILPGLDDGAVTLHDSIEMARLAWMDGITDIIATPHTHNGIYHNRTAEILKRVELLQRELENHKIPVRIHPGSEVHIHVECVENILSSDIMTICNQNKYVLLELPILNVPHFTEDLIYELTIRGITPILAHPERYSIFREDPSQLSKWIEQGAIAQLTAGSVLGLMGKRTKEIAEYMVKHRLVHLIATDAHNTEKRRPELKKAYQVLEEWVSGEEIQMYLKNAKAVLHGSPCQVLEPIQHKKRKTFPFFYPKNKLP
jgi:protein-tyrosine phosphatase